MQVPILKIEEYQQLERPNLKWLTKDLIPKPGNILLIGESFSGKTYMALQLALALAQGKDFAGKECNECKVLYLQIDTPELVFRNTLDSLKSSHINLSGNLYVPHPDHIIRPMNILETPTKMWLKSVYNQLLPDIVIIDVLREIHNADEDSSSEMKVVGDALFHDVFMRTDEKGEIDSPSILILHHTRKLSPDCDLDPRRVSRGTSYLPGKVDSIWLLHNESLRIRSRFDTDKHIYCKRLSNGFWEFPTATV